MRLYIFGLKCCFKQIEHTVCSTLGYYFFVFLFFLSVWHTRCKARIQWELNEKLGYKTKFIYSIYLEILPIM